MKKISLIIPVYNVEEYLKEALDSICNQTLKEFEAILINDGSTDNSLEVIEEYLEKDSRFILITQKNSGPGKARNNGLNMAEGEYIVFMDADDVLPEESLKTRYELIKEKEAEILVGGTFAYNGTEKWPIKTHFSKEGFKSIEHNEDLMLSLGPWNKIFKSELLKDIKFPTDIKYGEDQVFVMNSYMKAKKIYKTNENVYYYRKRNADENLSLTDLESKKPLIVLEQVEKAWEKIIDEIDKSNQEDRCRRLIKKKYFKRLLNINVWPPLMSLIAQGNKDNINEGFEILKEILIVTDKYILEESRDLKIILTYGIMRKKKLLKEENIIKYLDLYSYIYGDKNKKKIYIDSIINGIIYNLKKIVLIPEKIYKHIKYR